MTEQNESPKPPELEPLNEGRSEGDEIEQVKTVSTDDTAEVESVLDNEAQTVSLEGKPTELFERDESKQVGDETPVDPITAVTQAVMEKKDWKISTQEEMRRIQEAARKNSAIDALNTGPLIPEEEE